LFAHLCRTVAKATWQLHPPSIAAMFTCKHRCVIS
jgi:hypothetical protein